MSNVTANAVVGDRIEVKGSPGWSARMGTIVELLGEGSHRHFRVQWDNEHESLLYPTEGATIVHHPAARRAAGRASR
jgi:hypothetical protein